MSVDLIWDLRLKVGQLMIIESHSDIAIKFEVKNFGV